MKLNISNLNISYGDRQVVAGFSATINQGEKIALLGISGIGKTSIINAIMSLIPYEGTINFDQTPHIAAVFQEDRLIMEHNILTNIKIVSPQYGNSEIAEYIIRMGLNPKAPVNALSGGMKRKAAILRAVLAPSNLLIMDEPFKGLDDDTKQTVMSFVKEKASDRTMILITHNRSEAEFFNCRIIEL